MPPILVAGLDGPSLFREAGFLKREGHVIEQCPSARTLLEALPGAGPRLVVLGPALPDLSLPETVRRIRAAERLRQVSVLVLIPDGEPEELDGQVVAAGANALLRRPLEPGRLEDWLARLLNVPRRVEVRVPVRAQVLGSLREPTGGHFSGQARNLSLHGMLLASPVRLPSDAELELQLELPRERGRLTALGRVVREAPQVASPYVGYGVEFLFVPPDGVNALLDLVASKGASVPFATEELHSTLRRGDWVYELRQPVRQGEAWYVEIRRALRAAWRPGVAGPFYGVESRSPEGALQAARDFVHRYG